MQTSSYIPEAITYSSLQCIRVAMIMIRCPANLKCFNANAPSHFRLTHLSNKTHASSIWDDVVLFMKATECYLTDKLSSNGELTSSVSQSTVLASYNKINLASWKEVMHSYVGRIGCASH